VIAGSKKQPQKYQNGAAGRAGHLDNKRIRDLYTGLHALCQCHSIEAGRTAICVVGLYGVIWPAVFGEACFSRPRPSKVSLVHLWARLIAGGSNCSTPICFFFFHRALRQLRRRWNSAAPLRILLDRAIAVRSGRILRTAADGAD